MAEHALRLEDMRLYPEIVGAGPQGCYNHFDRLALASTIRLSPQEFLDVARHWLHMDLQADGICGGCLSYA